MAGCELDRGTLGPLVDTALRTTRPGVFAAGNLLHPAETADVCALDGRHAAPAVAAYLRGPGEWPSPVRLTARAPLVWVAPNLLLASDHPPPRDRFLLRSREFVRRARIQVRQDGRELWSGAGRPVGSRALGPHPRQLGGGGRSRFRPRDRLGEIGWDDE